jgi:hypothetical protein
MTARHESEEPPEVPLGLDAYRHWVRWPVQRMGMRAYLRSTYDRTGHNHTADASHFLYQEAEDFNVTLDVEGQGILCFVRTNRWHGSPWHYEIDGLDHPVEESTTADPLSERTDSVFIPERLFPEPLAYTYATTRGADLSWVPMAFDNRLRIAYSRTYYGTGYYIYQLLSEAGGLNPWSGEEAPDTEVLELLDRAGTDLVGDEAVTLEAGEISLDPDHRVTLAELDGPAMIRRLRISAPADRARTLGSVRLIVTWDGRAEPSIDAPLALFHGAGTLHNPDGREWLVKAFPVSIRFLGDAASGGRVELACYLPMPFFVSARIELAAAHGGDPIPELHWSVATEAYTGPWNHVGYLHATYRDHPAPTLGVDLEFLDTAGIEGADAWSGAIIGTSFIFTHNNVLSTLEGDPRFYFDDSLTPQVQGTGTEEWGGGGDYWGGRTMTLPLAGHPTGIVDRRAARHPDELIHSAYRFLIADAMPFGRRAQICFEHGGENESVEHYESVTYWYGLPSASLVLTDTLDVGDGKSEAAHDYTAPDATAPYTVSSRYEWGPDHVPVALAGPLPTPDDHVDFEFEAPAGSYAVWLEVRVGETLFDAAVWLQFNEHIGTSTLDLDYMGAMGILNAGPSPGAYRFTSGARPVGRVRLSPGNQRLRVQPRHGTLRFSRILLSPDRQRRPPSDVEPGPGEILILPHHAARRGGAYERMDDPSAPSGAVLMLTHPPRELPIFPAREMTGRRTDTSTELTLVIEPDNHGVLLRRTLDYGFANQRARVYVGHEGDWQPAGVWYLAGSNTVYHSFPWVEGELAPVRPVIITSNRRLRDDEFLLPSRLTRGKDRVRLRLEFAPRNPPLLKGLEPAPTAWTAFEYRAYSYVLPRVTLEPVV